MKRPRNIFVAAFIVASLAQTGCGHKGGDGHAHAGEQDDAAHAREAEQGISFQAKYGLLVPASTAKFIALQVADVEERKVASLLQFPAQVYRAANEVQFASAQAMASATVGRSQAALLRDGLAVTVAVEGSGALTGRLAGVSRELEKASGQVEVLLVIDDAQARLAKGAFVSVTVPLGGEKSVASVPRSALFRTTEGDFVYTVSGERFVRALVKLGVVNQEFAEVSDGLFEGDKIVVNPVMTLWMAELQSIRGGKACADGH